MCAKCAAYGSTQARWMRRWSRRCRAPARPARWPGARRARRRITPLVLPFLEEVLRLTIETGKSKAALFGTRPTTPCSMRTSRARAPPISIRCSTITPAFCRIFRAGCWRGRRAHPPSRARGPFPVERQRELGLRLMQILGFDFHHGRLDVSLHPFTGGATGDQRITTRYGEADFSSSLMGTIHETGHALYEQHLPQAWRHQPVAARAAWWCTKASRCCWKCRPRARGNSLSFAAPLMREVFESGRVMQHGSRKTCSTCTRAFAQPHPHRSGRSQLSGPRHPALSARARADCRRPCLARPARRLNEAMKALLGVVPPDDRLGCLQDIHWYDGAFGYFPTYTLGAMAAAQLFDAAGRSIPGLSALIGRGEFGRWSIGYAKTCMPRRAMFRRGSCLSRRPGGGWIRGVQGAS